MFEVRYIDNSGFAQGRRVSLRRLKFIPEGMTGFVVNIAKEYNSLR